LKFDFSRWEVTLAAQMDFGTHGFDDEPPQRAVFGTGLHPGTLEWDHFQFERQAEFNRWRGHLIVPIKQMNDHRASQTGPLFNLWRIVARWWKFLWRP
jgi:hypothetical protein